MNDWLAQQPDCTTAQLGEAEAGSEVTDFLMVAAIHLSIFRV
ncbi:MAG TPA: hypothetical protein VMX16_18170 [Terriglobia bacterium]|nr:hypothetical protein [Terriglobia bacterium]